MLAKGPKDGALLELSSEAVAARAKEVPTLPPLSERVKDRSGDDVPEAMMDYAFGDAETIILVIVDRMTGCINTSQQTEKGATDHATGT
eukprot:4680622-Amphidinium_carterae.1